MKPPLLRRTRYSPERNRERNDEYGITMVLVAIAMVAIIAMAALSIDVVTLYLAKEEAQRTADSAALAAARIISLSGVTGDPNNSTSWWASICGGSLSPATQAATSVGMQSTVGSVPATVSVTYSAKTSGSQLDCSALPLGTGINNPLVTVQVTRPGLPTFFSRIWGNTGNSVSASATAEVYNPSNSGNIGNAVTGTIIPVQPRCVKPWIIPNRDPLNPGPTGDGTYCDVQDANPPFGTRACNPLVKATNGSLQNPGISLNGTNTNGVIGETFWLEPDCIHTGNQCTLRNPSPLGNYYASSRRAWLQAPPSMEYLPGETSGATPVAVPSCASGSSYEQAVGGCDQSTVYQCGVQSSSTANPNKVDLSENPGAGTNDTLNGVKCMINESTETQTTPSGQDTLDQTSYPFKIHPGSSNPILSSYPNSPMTSSSSIVSLPIYDDAAAGNVNNSGATDVTIIGFLQVFINRVDPWGNVSVTVLNVAGCSNGSGPDPVGGAVSGSSPVPVRLITPP